MAITAAQVKALRDATGVGMMDCKRALQECDGDLSEAKLLLKKKGIADSKKRAGRTASEGVVVAHILDSGRRALLLELNCETDFVARNEDFLQFATELAQLAAERGATTLGDLLGSDWGGTKVSDRILEQSGKTGEKLVARRLAWIQVPEKQTGQIGSYIHDGGKIGVIVAMTAASEADLDREEFTTLARDLAMHVAASDPAVVSVKDIDPAVVDKEREVLVAQAAETGKPPQIVEKIVMGRLAKWKKEISLTDQPFVKNPDLVVSQHVAQVSKSHLSGPAQVTAFARFRIGEAAEA